MKMPTLKRTLLYLTLCSVMSSLAFPLIGAWKQATKHCSQKTFQFNCKPLTGMEPPARPPKLAVASWLDGSFQKQFDDWFTGNFGARYFLVRMNNQLLYDLFSRSYMYGNTIIADNRHVLYTDGYLADAFHKPTAEERQKIHAFVCDLERLQRALSARHVAMAYVISPSKGVEYKPQLPPWPTPQIALKRRYNVLVDELRNSGVAFIDAHAKTDQIKNEAVVQAYPRGGIHWSYVLSANVLNDVIDRLNQQTNKALPKVAINRLRFGEPDHVEGDLALLCNLLHPDTKYAAQHADFGRLGGDRPYGKVVFEGCSFTGGFTEVAAKADLFASMQHYFYYTQVRHSWPDGRNDQNLKPSDIDWERDILNADAIVIENNEALAIDHNHKFVKDALAHLEGARVATSGRTQ